MLWRVEMAANLGNTTLMERYLEEYDRGNDRGHAAE